MIVDAGIEACIKYHQGLPGRRGQFWGRGKRGGIFIRDHLELTVERGLV